MMLQPYLETVETEGELSALYFDGVFSHGVRKIPVPGDYRVQDDFGASDEPYSFSLAEETEIQGILSALQRVLSQQCHLEEALLYASIEQRFLKMALLTQYALKCRQNPLNLGLFC